MNAKKFFSKKFLMMFSTSAVVAMIGASVPAHQAQAFWVDGIFNIQKSLVNFLAGMVAGDNIIIRFFNFLMITVLSFALNVISYGVYFGAWLIDIMLDPLLYHNPAYDPSVVPAVAHPGVLDSMTIMIGWTTVRDMCNIFFIFFLLLIAFAMILRVQKFGNTKALLAKFIISIFLINFSMVIAKVIIDVGQVFMYEIVSWMGSFQDKAGSLTSIVDNFKNEVNMNIGHNTFNEVIKAAFAVVYSAMLMLIYIMLAGFLLIRLIAFVILIIVSPFAFLSLVLPSMSKYTNEWFDSLVKYTLFGPVFLFFIYLSATMANELANHSYAPVKSVGDMSAITEIVTVMIPHVIALAMLYAVIPVTQRLGVAGSKQLIGGTAGLGNIVMGSYAGIKLAGGLGRKAGAPITRRTGLADKYRTVKGKTLQKISENKIAQNIGLGGMAVQISASDFAKQRAKVDNYKKWIRQGSTESRWTALQQSQGKSPEEVAANIETMIEKKEINEEDAKAHGFEGKRLNDTLTRATPAMDADKLKESMPHWAARSEMVGLSEGNEKEKKVKERTAEITKELVSEGKLGSLNRAAKQDATVINTIEKEHDDFDKWATSQSKTDRGAIATALMKNAKIAVAGGNDKEALRFKTKAAKAGMKLEEAFKSFGRSADDATKDIADVFNKFSAKRVAQFSDEELSKYGYNATSSQSRNIHRAGKEDKLNIIRKSKGERVDALEKGREEGKGEDEGRRSKRNEEIINLRGGINSIDSMISDKTF